MNNVRTRPNSYPLDFAAKNNTAAVAAAGLKDLDFVIETDTGIWGFMNDTTYCRSAPLSTLSLGTIPKCASATTGLLTNSLLTEAGSVVTMTGTLKATVDLNTPIIKPPVDGTAALKLTRADGATSVMAIDTTNSRIGIGTDAPQTKVAIHANAPGAAGPELSIVNYSTPTVASSASLAFAVETSTYGGANSNAQIKAELTNVNGATDLIVSSWTGAAFTEKTRLTSAGDFGIGTPTPGGRLDVKSAATNSTIIQCRSHADVSMCVLKQNADNDCEFSISKSTGAIGCHLHSDGNSYFDSSGYLGVGTNAPSNKFTVVETGAGGTSSPIPIVSIYDKRASGNQFIAMAFSDDLMSNPCTDIFPSAKMYAYMGQPTPGSSAEESGFVVTSFSDDVNYPAFKARAVSDWGTGSDYEGVINMDFAKRSGTSTTSLDDASAGFDVSNNGTSKFKIYGNGDLSVAGSIKDTLTISSASLAKLVLLADPAVPANAYSIQADNSAGRLEVYAGTTRMIRVTFGSDIYMETRLQGNGGFASSDGSVGATESVAVAKVGGGTRTLTFKNGLYISYADS